MAGTPDALREPGVLYLDENLPEKLEVKLEHPIHVYFDRGFETPAAAFAAGQLVRLVGVIGSSYLVSGQYRGNKFEGWVKVADFMPPVDPKILQQAEANQRKRDAIRQAIEENRVLEGMTFAEVKKSLGRPERASSRQEAGQGRIDTWKYIKFESIQRVAYVPGPFGTMVAQTYTERVPTGELTVEFSNGVVTSIEEHQRADGSGGVKVPLSPARP